MKKYTECIVQLLIILKYIEYYYESELQTDLFKEEQEFEKHLTDNPKSKDQHNHRSVNNRKVWIRNPKYASEALAYADYLLEFDNKHQHFISKFNGENYVEAHYLIPMQYQEQYDNILDIHANIVSLCLVCHKQIHYGQFQDKKEILDKLLKTAE